MLVRFRELVFQAFHFFVCFSALRLRFIVEEGKYFLRIRRSVPLDNEPLFSSVKVSLNSLFALGLFYTTF